MLGLTQSNIHPKGETWLVASTDNAHAQE